MSDTLTIKTNNVPRLVIDAYELTIEERLEFDYLDWNAIETGSDSATFFRYKGQLYDLGEFQTTSGMPDFSPLRQWDGYLSDSFFSGIVVRFMPESDWDHVIVGTFYA
jgi:hypothetical protein